MHNWEGRYERSLDHLRRWQTALDATTVNQVGRQWNQALALAGKGAYTEALEMLQDALAGCERTGEMLFRARLQNTLGWVLSELQDHETAIEWDRRSEETALQIKAADPEIECNARLNMGDSLSALGRHDEAERYYRMVEQVVRNPGTIREQFALWLYSQHFFHSYGEYALNRGEHDQALALAEECVQLAESTNRPKNVVKGRRLRGQVLTALGKLGEAETELEMALAIAIEIGNPPQLWKTYVALGELRRAQGREDEALGAFGEALNVIHGVAERLEDASLRETLMSSPHVEAIRQAAPRA
jgi:tetratricopeptide (TPR) repeat protein